MNTPDLHLCFFLSPFSWLHVISKVCNLKHQISNNSFPRFIRIYSFPRPSFHHLLLGANTRTHMGMSA